MKVLGWMLVIIGILCVISAGIIQCIVQIQSFGIMSGNITVVHWSLWLLFGIIPMLVGWIILGVYK